MNTPDFNATTVLLSVAGLWTVAVVTPGPNFFLTVQTAIGGSRPQALWSVLGTSCGTVVWGLAGFFGLALLFQAAPWLYGGLKLLGGGYLIYLGVKLLRPGGGYQGHNAWGHHAPVRATGAWRAGLLTNLSNPKTAAFVTGLFAASMPAAAPAWLGLASVALMTTLSLVWYAAVACFFSGARCTRIYQRSRRWIDRTAGIIFIAYGARLATDR
ncbi:MAG: LysE family transporter [Desulfobacterales bacterium]|nr:LysE family transporter [Desulfobacterales bacterium]